MASNNVKIRLIFVVVVLVATARLLRLERRKAQAKKKKKKKATNKIAALWCPSVGRSGGPVFPALSSAGWRVCYLHTITPPLLSRSTANTVPHICHHSDGVTNTMYCCFFKKRTRDPAKKQRVNHPFPVWVCALDPASEKRS